MAGSETLGVNLLYADMFTHQGKFYSTFALRWVWLSSVFYLCGGGLFSANAMIFNMAADSCSEAERYVTQGHSLLTMSNHWQQKSYILLCILSLPCHGTCCPMACFYDNGHLLVDPFSRWDFVPITVHADHRFGTRYAYDS